MAETQPPGETAPDNTELKRLQDELDIEKKKREMSEFLAQEQISMIAAQKNAIAGMIPEIASKSLAGTVESSGDTTGYVSEQVAYHGLKMAAVAIKTMVESKLILSDKVLIVKDLDQATDDIAYTEVRVQFDLYESVIRKQIEAIEKCRKDLMGEKFVEPVLAGLLLAPSILATIADIAGYFKSDYTIRSATVALEDEGLIATVAGELSKTEGRMVYIINDYLLNYTADDDTNTKNVPEKRPLVFRMKDFHESILDLSNERQDLAALIEKVNAEVTALKGEIAQLEAKKSILLQDPENNREEIAAIEVALKEKNSRLKTREGWLIEAARHVQASDQVLSATETFLKGIATSDPAQTPSILARAVRREKIRLLEITHLLYLKVISKGGETISRTRAIWPCEYAFIGGSVANCILVKKEGQVVASDFFPILCRCDFELDGWKSLRGKTNSSLYPIDLRSSGEQK